MRSKLVAVAAFIGTVELAVLGRKATAG